MTEMTSTLTVDLNDETTFKLQAECTDATSVEIPNSPIRWTSSNAKVATVDATGVVVLKAVGKAVVTAAALDGSGKKATLTITTVCPPQAMTLLAPNGDEQHAQVAVGKSITLSKQLLPTKYASQSLPVTWSCDNTAYAKVSSRGVVTGLAAGLGKTVTITATLNSNKFVSAAILVDIKPKTTSVEVPCTTETMYLSYGEVNVQMYAMCLPEEASQNIKWTSMNPKVATITADGMVTALQTGVVTLVATAQDGSGVTKKIVLTIE